MIVPNKFTPLDRSLLAKAPEVLGKLADDTQLVRLYEELRDSFEDPAEFILALDVLFVLGKISIEVERKAVVKC